MEIQIFQSTCSWNALSQFELIWAREMLPSGKNGQKCEFLGHISDTSISLLLNFTPAKTARNIRNFWQFSPKMAVHQELLDISPPMG